MEIMTKINDEKKSIEDKKFRTKFNEELDTFLEHLEKKHQYDLDGIDFENLEVSNPLIQNHSPIESPRGERNYNSTQRDVSQDRSLNNDINALKQPQTSRMNPSSLAVKSANDENENTNSIMD